MMIKRAGLVMLVAVMTMSLLSACANNKQAVEVTRIPPPMVQALGDGNLMVENMCLDVTINYVDYTYNPDYVPTYSQSPRPTPDPALEKMAYMIRKLGIMVTRDNCQATMTVVLEFMGRRALYSSSAGPRNCFTGAGALMETEFSVEGMKTVTSVQAIKENPTQIGDCPTKDQAPFDWVLDGAMAETIGHIWGPEALLVFVDDERVNQDAVIQALGGLGPKAIPVMTEYIHPEGVIGQGREAWKALCQIGTAGLDEILVMLAGGDELDRRQAAIAMSHCSDFNGQEQIIPALIAATKDESIVVRCEALSALGMFAPEHTELIPVMVVALGEEDSMVREYALSALGGYAPEHTELIPVMVAALSDKSYYVRDPAISNLEVYGPEAMEAVPALIEGLGDRDQRFQNQCLGALTTITGQDFGSDAEAWSQWWSQRSS